MKIAIVGYGSMGQLVQAEAVKRGFEVISVIDPFHRIANHKDLTADSLEGADVAIDFTLPATALENIQKYCELKLPAVIGTTGWYDSLGEAEAMVSKAEIPFLWSSNFSIGVNAYFRIIREAARVFSAFPEYDVWGHEMHHVNKADSPSGTAKTITDIVLNEMGSKETAVYESLQRKINPSEFHFSSVRGGKLNFEHTVGFDSEVDQIKISHSARNRGGYAAGAVAAAGWLLEQNPGFYSVDDFMNSLLGEREN